MGSFDVNVPDGFADGDTVISQCEEYLSSSMLDLVLSQVATDDVKDILKNGVDGATAAYEQQGNLGDVLRGAVSSAANGVAAKVQDNIKGEVIGIIDETTGGLGSIVIGLKESGSVEEYLKGLADEKTGGLLGSISGIVNYDKTPTALLQSISDTANSSSKQVMAFLGKETVNSADLSEMMYQYSQFGNALDSLRSYGGTVSYNWKNNYEKMEMIYERFVRNEMMIEMLSAEGAINE
jgi:hypothetical protein